MKSNRDKPKAMPAKIPKHSTKKSYNSGLKNKPPYIQHQRAAPVNYVEKYETYSDIGSANSKYEISKLQSANGDESDSVRLEYERDSIVSDMKSKLSDFKMNRKDSDSQSEFKSNKTSFFESKSEMSGNPKQNEKVDLSNQNLLEVPMSLCFSNKLIKSLKLSFNKLTNLPDKICDLIFLNILLVDNNLLKSLPKSIGKLTYLK